MRLPRPGSVAGQKLHRPDRRDQSCEKHSARQRINAKLVVQRVTHRVGSCAGSPWRRAHENHPADLVDPRYEFAQRGQPP